MSVAILVNLNAGAVRKQPGLVEDLRGLCSGRARVMPTADRSVLAAACAELASSDCSLVGVVGGDGSAAMTLTALWQAWGERPLPSVALLGGGTMNTIAHSLGTPKVGVLELLSSTLAAWERATVRVRARPSLRVHDKLGFLFGTGAFHRFLARYNSANGGHPTRWTAAHVFAQGFASALIDGPLARAMLAMTPFEVEVEGCAWPRRYYLTVAAGTVPDAGLGFRPFHRAFESDDLLQVIGVHGRPREVALELPRLALHAGLPARVAQSALVREFSIHCPEGDFGYSLDGDLAVAPRDLTVALGPKFSFVTTA